MPRHTKTGHRYGRSSLGTAVTEEVMLEANEGHSTRLAASNQATPGEPANHRSMQWDSVTQTLVVMTVVAASASVAIYAPDSHQSTGVYLAIAACILAFGIGGFAAFHFGVSGRGVELAAGSVPALETNNVVNSSSRTPWQLKLAAIGGAASLIGALAFFASAFRLI